MAPRALLKRLERAEEVAKAQSKKQLSQSDESEWKRNLPSMSRQRSCSAGKDSASSWSRYSEPDCADSREILPDPFPDPPLGSSGVAYRNRLLPRRLSFCSCPMHL